MKPLLSLEDITKSRGTHRVLSGVNLTLGVGELMVLSGPSGAGKTTLLRLVAGLEAPDAGRIRLDGVEMSKAGSVCVRPSDRSVTMVFQDLALWPNLSVVQNVSIGLSGLPLSRKQSIERARETLDHCGILKHSKRLPAQLSGGELQQVALARALAPRPKIVLLDEPFVFLDVVLKAQLFEKFASLRETYRFATLVVTHNPGDAIGMKADRVAILEKSTICETIETHDLSGLNPKSETLRAWRATLRASA